MQFEVGSGYGTLATSSEAWPTYDELYGDGTVTLTPYLYDPETDPPPDVVYVTDLPVQEHGVGTPQESFATEYLGIIDDSWIGTGDRTFRAGAVLSQSDSSSRTLISLTSPSTLTTLPRARFCFQVSTTLDRDLEYQHVSRQRHPYTRSLFLDYDYYITAAQEATGWETLDPLLLYEEASFGGSIGDDEWSIRYEGGGQATLINGGETDVFDVEADTLYILEVDGTGATAVVTLYLADGDEPGTLVATTTRSRSDPGSPGSVDVWSTSALWADAMEVAFDWIRVVSGTSIDVSPGQTVRDDFTGDGVTDSFTLSAEAIYVNRVTVDGIVVENAEVVGTTLTLDRAPASGSAIRAEWIAA